MRNRERGKDLEKFLAGDLNARRIGLLGMEDISHPRYSIECKERAKLPAFLKKCMEQAESNCESGKTPIVILHELNSCHGDDLVIMRYKHFKEANDEQRTQKDTSRGR